MNAVEHYTGLSVSASHLDWVLLPSGRHKQIENNPQGIDSFITQLEALHPVLVLVQADVINSTVYHDLIEKKMTVQTVDFSDVPQVGIVPVGMETTAFYLAQHATQIRTKAASPMNTDAQVFGILLTRRLQLLDMLLGEQMRAKMMQAPINVAQETQQEINEHISWLLQNLQKIDINLEPLWRNLLDK